MQADELRNLISIGYESRSVEFKSAGAWGDAALQAQLKKACLAMGNTRDGGVILVGVRPVDGRPGIHEIDPLSPSQLQSFDLDVVIPQINAHVSPHLEIQLEQHGISPGKSVIAIGIKELRDLPFLCVREIIGETGRVLVPRGRILVRSRRAHESTDLQYPEDLRELVDLVVDKGMETYFRRRRIKGTEARPTDAEQFKRQLEGL